jgi:hypothetical protein
MFAKRREAERDIGSDKMNIMAAFGQFDPQFGRNHTAPAVGRVTRDAYFH